MSEAIEVDPQRIVRFSVAALCQMFAQGTILHCVVEAGIPVGAQSEFVFIDEASSDLCIAFDRPVPASVVIKILE